MGAYSFSWLLDEALQEQPYDYFTNLEIIYIQVIEPLRAIAQRANKGGANRFIARSQFRRAVEDCDWIIDRADFEDFLNEDDHHHFDGEEVYWVIFHDGGGITWSEDIEGPDDVVNQLLKDDDCDLIVYYEYQLGYLYVIKSPVTMEGRLNKQQKVDGYIHGLHPFQKVVVFDEDHPDYLISEAPALPLEVLERAAELYREYGDE